MGESLANVSNGHGPVILGFLMFFGVHFLAKYKKKIFFPVDTWPITLILHSDIGTFLGMRVTHVQ